MRKTLPLLFSAGFIMISSAAFAQNTMIRMPNMRVDTNNQGQDFISMGGMNVNTKEDNAHIQMPSMTMQTNGQRNTYIQTPHANIQTETTNTRVQAPEINIQSGYAPAYPVQQPHSTATHIQRQRSHIQMQAPAPSMRSSGMIGSGMSYVNANLSGKDFRNKYLVGADFTNANIANADFSGADLRGSIFVNADLTNAKFINANMMGANLTNAIFMHTNVSGANMNKANLTNVGGDKALAIGTSFEGITQINTDMSIFIRHQTTLPPVTAQRAIPIAPEQPKAAVKTNTTRPALTTAESISQTLTAPTKTGEVQKIDLTVNFNLDSDMLTEAGMRQVKEIADALNSAAVKGSRIRIEGHTDDTGSADYNQELSYRRAMRVLFTLRDQFKVPGSTLEAKGLGESKPLANNKTDMGRMINRRVTIVNLGK